MEEKEFDQEFEVKAEVESFRDDPELIKILDAIGSDYDDDGIAYWKKLNRERN